MRITLLTDRYAPEARAAAYLSQELAEGLARLGHDVTVLTRKPTHFVPGGSEDTAGKSETAGRLTVRRVSGINSMSKIWLRAVDQLLVSLKLMLLVCFSRRADVLVIYSPPLLLCLSAVVQRWFRRMPVILNLHDLYPKTAVDLGILKNRALIRLAALLETMVYASADKIVVAAPASKRILIEENRIPADRVEMMFNYIDTRACSPGPVENEFRKRHGLENRFVVLYAGLMGLAQDLSSLIEVARTVRDDPDWLFVLAGDGPCVSRWAELAKDLPNVRMVGSLPITEYYAALQAADVCLVILSAAFKAPAVPGKVASIMAAGRPIVASVPAENDTRGILETASAGAAVAPGRPDELLRALTLLKEDPALRAEWGRNAAQYARMHFDAQKAIERFDGIVQSTGTGAGTVPQAVVPSGSQTSQ